MTAVKGYRQLSPELVNAVNANKELEERVLRQLDAIMKDPETDGRWAAIARTQLEQGFMALNRSIFKPQRIALPEDVE